MSSTARMPPALWPEVSALFDEATALPAHERSAWWQRLQAGRPELAPHLQRLLAAHDSSAALAPPSGELLHAALGAQLHTRAAGQLVGIYRLLEPLGQGGMSSVWLAEQTQGVLRRVALKLPHPSLEAPAALARRFEQERDLLAGLEHRHIARLYDAGITAEGQPFLAMEWVAGRPITEAAAGLPLRARLRLFQQVLAAVAFAHGRLVIHRDLKPGNILVGDDGQVRLLDFGIARLLGDGEGAAAQASRAFTPECAPPEQLEGAALGATADVYALGVVLYELLTGRRPYTLDRGSPLPLAAQLRALKIEPPSAAAPAQRRALAGDLDAIVARAMALAPEARYPSVEALAADIEQHLQHGPVAARGGGRGYLAGRFLRRHRLAVAAASSTLLALGLGLGLALWQAGAARQQAARAQARGDFLVSLFKANALDQDDALRRRQQTVQQLLESSARRLASPAAGPDELRADLQGVVGGVLHELALNEAALALRHERVALLARERAAPAMQAQALLDEAETLLQLGRAAEAEAPLQAALQQAAGGPLRAAVRSAQGQAALARSDLPAAQAHLEEATQLARQAPVDAAVLAGALTRLGQLRSLQARPADSVAALREAIAVWSAVPGGQVLGLAQAWQQLGEELGTQRRVVDAIQALREAVQMLRERAGPEHVQTALMTLELGRMISVHGKPMDGRPLLEQAAQVLLAHPDDVSPARRVLALAFVGESYIDAGELAPAAAWLERAVALEEREPQAARPDALPLLQLARVRTDTGDWAGALAALQSARQRRVAAFGDGHPAVASVDNRIGLVHLAQGRLDEAERLFTALRDTDDPRRGNFGSVRDQARHNLRAVQMDRGRFDTSLLEPARAALAQVNAQPAAERNRGAEFSLNLRLGRVLLGLQQPAEARPYLERALQLALEDQHPASPRRVVALARLATCLAALGEHGAAAARVAEAEAVLRQQPQMGPHLHALVQQARSALR